jgi:hypothetical protein
MTHRLRHRRVLAVLAVLLAIPSSGCVATGGYGDVGYAPGYYEPYGTVYGGWGPNYRVGPVRDGNRSFDHRPVRAGRSPGRYAFRPAPAGRRVPSIPSGSRPGGGRAGGGRPRG